MRERERDEWIRAGEGVRVQTDFTLQGPGQSEAGGVGWVGWGGTVGCLWQGDSARLIGLVLAPRWRTEQVSVRMILGGEFNLDVTLHTHRRATTPPTPHL